MGKIVTFYSFKGGVGRTMALANVAFLAAYSGKRVLVMDWDLEAPGLGYYFRGLHDAGTARAVKEAPGVLNLLWNWVDSVSDGSVTADELQAQKVRYGSGEAFSDLAIPIANERDYFPENARLDYIGAGSPIIRDGNPMSYEEALSQFSWGDFFQEMAGGFVLESLRHWAKSNYDLVLIDSRTGLADVAGICTMQMPDEVAICFILNRQNIDGAAKVSAAIRTKRSEAVKVRAVPMRVARQDTSEESDARARAIAELTKIGGFSSDAVLTDFNSLAVMAAENVPFYETLAPFVAREPKLDPLTLNYIGLASELAGFSISIPEIDSRWITRVRQRLLPRRATIEYLNRLKAMEPARAVADLLRLLDSALDVELDGGGLEEDYVSALIEATIEVAEFGDREVDTKDLKVRALELLRELTAQRPEKWKPVLIEGLERYLDSFAILVDREEQFALLEELDALLAASPLIETRIKRIRYRRRAMGALLAVKGFDVALQIGDNILANIKKIMTQENDLASDQIYELIVAEADVARIKGEVAKRKGLVEEAKEAWRHGIQVLSRFSEQENRLDAERLKFILYRSMAAISTHDPHEASRYALLAVVDNRDVGLMAGSFPSLAIAVLSDKDNPAVVIKFVDAVFGSDDPRLQRRFLVYFTTAPTVKRFLSAVNGLLSVLLRNDSERMRQVIANMIACTESVIERFADRVAGRRAGISGRTMTDEVVREGASITQKLRQSENFKERSDHLEALIGKLRHAGEEGPQDDSVEDLL